MPVKNRNEFGIWSWAWTFSVKLRCLEAQLPTSHQLVRTMSRSSTRVILSSVTGKTLPTSVQTAWYRNGPSVVKCGISPHYCYRIRCHLGGDLGHLYSHCPRSFANAVAAPVEESHENDPSEGMSGTGRGVKGPVNKRPSMLRRLKRNQKSRELFKYFFIRITPFLFTSRQLFFGGDFNTVTR